MSGLECLARDGHALEVRVSLRRVGSLVDGAQLKR
ncbi:hypothetical protein AALP_AA2G113600 [Arabis alpina]|uniref:Uncharacterized protein n=1 Tax=Arabis alpina TaxID=50452 RepID=A0A087HGQ8_ARAAL|nr:hypothetical protein AALP_AA2G113600 [Arabis alpina]